MSYSIIPVESVLKGIEKANKKVSFTKNELSELSLVLKTNPTAGTALGNNLYKIRVAIKSKGVGKSGGARVITYVITENKEVSLLTIYDKGELETVDDRTLRNVIQSIKNDE